MDLKPIANKYQQLYTFTSEFHAGRAKQNNKNKKKKDNFFRNLVQKLSSFVVGGFKQ